MDYNFLINPFRLLLEHVLDAFRNFTPRDNVYIILFSTVFVFFSFYCVKRLVSRG